ncbi:hypothetical protein J3459_011497 [Metarhizium acridum]|nr:hypothetical protein J3459_011497 [Metarhizium acridum]
MSQHGSTAAGTSLVRVPASAPAPAGATGPQRLPDSPQSPPPDSLEHYLTINFSHQSSPPPNTVYPRLGAEPRSRLVPLEHLVDNLSRPRWPTPLGRFGGTMNPKNWNDRADKDLFFTILSVKNIGVISGAEWTTIGNHMRTLGYGFTNEGCRQHFQGLRRSQNKAEAKSTAPEMARRVDPTLNPITRRPGPGRGRPRKLPAAGAEAESPVDGAISPASASAPTPAASVAAVHAPSTIPTPGTTQEGNTADQQAAQQQQQQQQQPPSPPPQPTKSESVAETTPESTAPPAEALAAAAATETTDAADGAPGEQDGDADVDGTEEPPVKRQRLDTQELDQEQPLDDEAVLALAAHNGATGSDYPEDFSYGEA